MDLLTNAVSSITVGIEDYKIGTPERLLSAVRNIHAGVLLLYKEALRRKSPAGSEDVLVKSTIRPQMNAAGELEFVGSGKKTVDVFEMRQRFESLGINTDWKLLQKISDARNELEHYIPKQTQAALEGLIASACEIIRDFAKRELQEDPLKLFGEQVWQEMLGITEVYEKELAECKAAMKSEDWESNALATGIEQLTCLECGSDLLCPTVKDGNTILTCSKCGETESLDSYVPRAIDSLEGVAYAAMKDGGDDPFASCPECGEETYIMAEKKCALCQHRLEHTCERCGSEIPASEMMCSPLCGYCSHMEQRMLEA